MDPSSTMPSWRSGKTHGFCVTGGHSPIASEPTPSPRLWATTPGATPARLCEHTMRVQYEPSKPELSTWLGHDESSYESRLEGIYESPSFWSHSLISCKMSLENGAVTHTRLV